MEFNDSNNSGGQGQGAQPIVNNSDLDLGSMFIAQESRKAAQSGANNSGASSGSNNPGNPSGTDGAAEGGAAGGSNPTNNIDLDAILSERTGGKIKSFNDIESALSRPDLSKHPELMSFVDYFNNGGDWEGFSKIQTLNPETMTSADLMKWKLSREYPKASEEQLNYLFDIEYKQSDAHGPDDQLKGQLRLDKEADKIREEVADYRQKLTVPSQKQRQERQEQAMAEKKREVEAYVQSEIKNFSQVEISAGEQNTPFVFTLSSDEQAKIADLAVNLSDQKLIQELGGAGENFNVQKLFRGLYLALNAEKVFSAYSGYSKAQGQVDYRGRITNQGSFDHNGRSNYAPNDKPSVGKAIMASGGWQ